MTREQLTRRQFCAATVGIGITSLSPLSQLATTAAAVTISGPTDLERYLARNPFPSILGHPYDWSLVRQGLHPFSPERVFVIPVDTELQMTAYDVKTLTRELMSRNASKWCQPDVRMVDCGPEKDKPAVKEELKSRTAALRRSFLELCPTEKGALCIRLVRAMTDYYRIPSYLPHWAAGLIHREALGSSSTGGHGGFVHQFQRSTQIMASNHPVDWWLFLIPDGIDYQSFDGKPVHVLFGLVVSRTPEFYGATVELGTLCFMSQFFHRGSGIDMRAVSRMDRVAAARCLNSHIPTMLANGPWHKFTE